MNKGMKTIEVFDEKYFKIGDAFQISYKNPHYCNNEIIIKCVENNKMTNTLLDKSINAVVIKCNENMILFAAVMYSPISCQMELSKFNISCEDLDEIEIKRLIAED